MNSSNIAIQYIINERNGNDVKAAVKDIQNKLLELKKLLDLSEMPGEFASTSSSLRSTNENEFSDPETHVVLVLTVLCILFLASSALVNRAHGNSLVN